MTLSKQQWAALEGFVLWGAETGIGLIPLLAFAVMHKYAGVKDALRYEIVKCTKGIAYTSQCTPIDDSIYQEMCILTVVIAGLAMFSQFSVGPHRRKAEFTVLTYILMFINFLALGGGMLLYAIYGVHLDSGADAITFWVLMTALATSLSLSLESSILDA